MNKIRYSYLIGCTTFLFFIGYIVFSIISVSGLGAFYLRRGSVDCVFALDGVVFESSRWIASPLRVAVLSSVEGTAPSAAWSMGAIIFGGRNKDKDWNRRGRSCRRRFRRKIGERVGKIGEIQEQGRED
jgi:hypothetical protein